jgi:cell division septation protein DedD
MARRGLLVTIAALALGGCGGNEHAKLAASTTASTGTKPPPSTTTPTAPAKPKAAPRHAHSRTSPPPGSSSEPSVETVTSDGSVLVLDNGDVAFALLLTALVRVVPEGLDGADRSASRGRGAAREGSPPRLECSQVAVP